MENRCELISKQISRDSGVKGIPALALFSSPLNFLLSPSDSPSVLLSLPYTIIPSICFLPNHFPFILQLFFHSLLAVTFSASLFLIPFTVALPFPLSSSGGHALECSFLHETTSAHYLLTTSSNVGGFPNISHGWYQGQ